MSLVEAQGVKDYRGWYFVFFEIVMNITLINIFTGMVMGISLQFFKHEIQKAQDEGASYYDERNSNLTDTTEFGS